MKFRKTFSTRKQLVYSCIALVGSLIAVTWLVVSTSQSRLIEFKSLQIASVIARQASIARSVYASVAVAKLKRDGFGADEHSENIPGTVPLPAQFLKALAHKTREDSSGLYRFKPVSRWNLSPDQGIEDEFQRWAWDRLAAQDSVAPEQPIDWQPAWRIEEIEGVETLRYLQADPASSESCVNCHNAIEKVPETIARRENKNIESDKQWQLNELMGAIEISIPLETSSAIAHEQTKNGLLIVGAVTVAGILIVLFVTGMDTARTRLMTERLEYQSTHDYLTSLPNRFGFERALGELVIDAEATSSHIVMLLDLDDFKRINDTLGHDVGDEVLKETARRLRASLRPGDHIARFGGDEFAVLLPDSSKCTAAEIAASMSSELDRIICVGEYELRSGASIGIALMPDHGTDQCELIRCADVALYVAKTQRTDFEFYHKDKDKNALSALSIIADFRSAMAENALSMHYQPKVDLYDGTVTGVEALLRWHHPLHGPIAPEEIVQTAERCGSIRELTHWTLINALEQLCSWRKQGFNMDVAVNLSARMLADNDIVGLVERALSETNVPSHQLILEITESAMMDDPHFAQQILERLNRLGVRISVDDFGTGYSSLAYIHRLPLQELKLDRSFVSHFEKDGKNDHIVLCAIQMAHSLDLQLVAEGVETQDTMDHLFSIGCDKAQGYYICRPKPADELTAELPQLQQRMLNIAGLRRAA